MVRRPLSLCSVLLVLAGLLATSPAVSAETFDPASVTVAVIDTGLTAPHPEFDYDPATPGPNGQVVAWWDFSSANQSGEPLDIWFDGRLPHDEHGHGTGTAGMAVGRNVDPTKNPSACPGCNLAVARVANDSGSLDGSLSAAIRWAVDVVGADVISMSIGGLVPLPGSTSGVHAAAAYAREAGVLMVVANGNGWGNSGVPGQPGAVMPYGFSTEVLSVGAAGSSGLMVTTDPEVTATFRVRTSHRNGGYGSTAGTSFSAPFVAGGAARLRAEALACGAGGLSPDRLERLLKVTAIDSIVYPPTTEGYGEVTPATVDHAAGVACGEEPEPSPDPVTELYVEHVSGGTRALWTDTDPTLGLVERPRVVARMTPTPLVDVTATGVIGASSASLADVEVHEVSLPPGATIEVGMVWQDPSSDLDLVLYETSGGEYRSDDLVASSQRSGADPELLQYTNHSATETRVFRLVVSGFVVTDDTAFTLSGVSGPPVFDGYAAIAHAA